jgi:proline iminopeptidase
MTLENIQRDGFILNYKIEGKGRPAVVIGSVDYYPQTFSQNLRQHLQLIFTDHRGFAKTTQPYGPSDYTLDKIVEDIEALRGRLNLDQMILIGHSGHAHMAVAYAKKYPQHVEHLILIGISPLENHEAADAYFEKLASPERKILLTENLKNTPANFIEWMVCFGPMLWYQHDFNAAHLWKNVHLNEDIFNYLWGEVFPNHDLRNDLKDLTIKIDVILGKYDFFNPPELWDNFRPNNAIFHVIEKSGHTPQLESAEEFDPVLISTKSSIEPKK